MAWLMISLNDGWWVAELRRRRLFNGWQVPPKLKVRCGWIGWTQAPPTSLIPLQACLLPTFLHVLLLTVRLLSFVHHDLSELGVSFGCHSTLVFAPSLRGR